VVDAGTVIYWALQIIYFLGFRKIYIAGLDMNNFNQPRFYESSDSMLPSYLEDKVHNLVIPSLKLGSKIFKSDNIEVINLSLKALFLTPFFPERILMMYSINLQRYLFYPFVLFMFLSMIFCGVSR
jgi:hypothetical protein